ncbi:MAG: hypothetical protein ABSE90_05405 [Verrucomicrobiota bacterium]
MNRNKTRVPTEFGPETRFELRPASTLRSSSATEDGPPAPFRATWETEFERLKNRLLAEQLAGATPEWNVPLRRAANEAAALAWMTFYPLLVFPVLFEEKTAAAVRQAERQARIYADSRELLAV